jgi:HEAT repeat protein
MWKAIYRSVCVTLLAALAALPAYSQSGKTPTEADLIKILKSGASLRDKEDACRQLATVGTRAAVPTLAELLSNEKLGHMARYALEPIPDPLVDEALRAAVVKLKGKPLVGVLGSIGVRRDAQATNALVKHLADPDSKVAQAAARSLGRIGTKEAEMALMRTLATNPPPANEAALYEALFRCAETMAAHGAREEAQSIYDVLRAGNSPPQAKVAALRGAILMRQGKDRLDVIRVQLRSEDRAFFAAAVRAAQEVPEPDVAQVLVADIKEVPAERRPLVIQALACVADRCLQRQDAADTADRLIGPLNKALEFSQTTELKEQTKTLLQAAHKLGSKRSSGAGGGDTPFLQVGKSYVFKPAPSSWGTFRGKVLEIHGDSWMKVRIEDLNQMPSDSMWVNLNQMMSIIDIPAANQARRQGNGTKE